MEISRSVAKAIHSEDFYLLIAGSLCSVLILAYQWSRKELQLDSVGNPALLIAGFALLVVIGLALFPLLRGRCDQVGFRLAFIGAMYLIVVYLAWPNRLDWPGWHDQGHYIRMTDELTHGYLTPDGFRMGLGYPLVSIPFYLLIGKDGLFIPNLIAFVGTLYFSYLFFRSLTKDLVAKITVLFMLFATTLPYHHVIWWNHGITIFCLIALSYVATKPSTNNRLALAGLLTGFAFFTRYLDAIVFLPLLVHVLWHSKPSKIKAVLIVLVAAAPFVIAPFVAQWLVFGDPLMSPYKFSFNAASGVFSLDQIPNNLFLTFLYYPESLALQTEGLGMIKMPVLVGAFYAIFAPLGAALLCRSSGKKGLVIGIATAVVVCVLYSSAFWQFHSGTFGQFPSDFRYLLLAYPYMVFFSIIGLFSFVKICKFRDLTQEPIEGKQE
ncbi:hypothetical protein A3K79_01835 [Candidatus Bathyarchaeota archaeon RBG_13_46_16b]|nr:MAG: hypothetical protein A3K79_01835 [Candidatus Bathyarchaeota archaeon RBG_13_46_16b]